MSKIRIIYIEDDHQQRHSLVKELNKQKFAVIAASSGQEGLEAVRKASADAVLCDLNMPDMSGLDVLKEIRKLDKELPVILLTAHGTVEEAVKALKRGATDFLLKPLQIHKIAATINNVIEKGSLREAVRRSQSSLQMLMESVPDIIYSLNEKGEFLSANQATEYLLGYKPAELIGTSVFDYIYPEDRKKTEAGYRNAVKSGDASLKQIQFRMVTKSGEVKEFEVNRRMIFENGKVIRQDGIARDISRRKKLKKELQDYSDELEKLIKERTERLEYTTRQLAALNLISNRFTQIHDEDELLEEAPELLTHNLDFDRASLLLKKNGEFFLRSYCLEKDSPELVENFLKRVHSKEFAIPPHFHESFENSETIFIPDLNADPRWPKKDQQIIRTKAVVISPIKVNKKPIGIIVGNMQHHQREMNQQDVVRFEMFTNMVGLAIENARAYQDLEKKVIERTKSLKDANRKLREKARELEKSTYSLGKSNVELLTAQEELEEKNATMEKLLAELSENEEKFRQLTETINEVFWMVDLETGKMLYVNPAYEEIYGQPAQALYQNSKAWLNAVHSDDLEIVENGIDLDVHKRIEQEFRIVHRDGSVRWIRSRPFPIKNSQGEVYRICGISEDITERKLATEALELERNFVSAILDTAGALVVVLDTEGRIVRFNRACEVTTGYKFEEVKDRPFWDIFLVPSEVLQVRGVFEKVRAGNLPSYNENYWTTRDGGLRLIAWSNSAIVDHDGNVDYVIGTGIDITERKAAEEKLKLYKEIFVNSSDPINIMDANGNLIEQNPVSRELIGYADEELQGKTPAIFAGEETFARIGESLSKTGTFRGEIVSRTKSGKRVDVELSAFTVYDEKGEVGYRIGFARDITERKKAEKALQKSLADLAETNKHLKETQSQLVQSEKMASLGMLVAGIAHEINTPIGAVTSMHDTLKRAVAKLARTLETKYAKEYESDKDLSKPIKLMDEANRIINSGTERVTNIIRRLRSFARLDEAELKTADIHEGLEDTLTLIHHEIKHNITIVKEFGDVPPIPCFPGRLNQVFLNILINGKQAIKDKGKITIKTSVRSGYVYLQFTDTGVGIEKEKLEKIFDPGFTTKGVGVGTGLGLSIVYQIIEEHQGEIKVTSKLGKGTTFTIKLPTDLDERLEHT